MHKAVPLGWQLQLHFNLALFILLFTLSSMMFTMFLVVLFLSSVVVSNFPVISDLYLFLILHFFLELYQLKSHPFSCLAMLFYTSGLHFNKFLEIIVKYLITTFCSVVLLFVCFSWSYSLGTFLLLDFSFFACRPLLVPFQLLFFEWGKLFWITKELT